MSISILHLSDIHTGPGELRDEDQKEYVPETIRQNMLSRLREYLADLDRTIDYVIISGDVAIRGDTQGFAQLRQWLIDAVDDGLLPETRRILIVPGNHDVQWREYGGSDPAERYRPFYDAFGTAFPHAYLPGCDPEPGKSWLTLTALAEDYVGGIQTRTKYGEVVVESSYPLILDNERNLLIYLFNSTQGCGVFLEDSWAILKKLENLIGVIGDSEPAIKVQLSAIEEAYRDSLRVDAGLLGEQQLTYFRWMMQKLRKLLRNRYHRLTKIAVLHHHVSHLWNQQLEVKRFESVIDAASFKQYLHESGFHLVLHGHKHQNHVSLDASVIPLEGDRTFNPLCIVSGGTVGGYPRINDSQSFKVVSLESLPGQRTTALIEQFDLGETAVPSERGPECVSTYHLPMTPRLPEIQDWPPMKEAFDAYLLAEYGTPQGIGDAPVISEVTGLTLPTAHPEILSEDSNYRFMRMVEYGNGKDHVRVFFDVLLAAQRLDFRQRARIYQILTDIEAYATRNGVRNQLVLIVGDLGETAFFKGDTPGEVASSVEELVRRFGSAVSSEVLRVIHHRLSQDEVDQLVESAQAAGFS